MSHSNSNPIIQATVLSRSFIQCSPSRPSLALSADERIQKLARETATDEAYQECSKYLRELGIDNRAELARIMDIATNPRSIYSAFQGKKGEANPTVLLDC